MPNTDLLAEIFSAKEEDVETFSDAFKDQVVNLTEPESYLLKKTAKLVTERQKFLIITHGCHVDCYVWHIHPAFQKKPWAVPIDKVLFAVGKVLNEHLPHDLLIDIFLPKPDWQIEEITVKALDAKIHWAVDDDILAKVTGQLFEVLNTLM